MKNGMKAAFLIFFVVLIAAAVADAAVTAVMVENPGVTLAGYTTYDLMVNSNADWTNARLELIVSYGAIYQYPGPEDDEVVQQSLWSSIPELQWDSWLAGPNLTVPLLVEPVQGSDGWTNTTVYRSWYDLERIYLTEAFIAARITVTEGSVLTYNGSVVFDSESGGIATVFSGIAAEKGDANYDGAVDILDLDILALHWGDTGASWTDGDFDQSGIVDILDLNLLADNWGIGGATGMAGLSNVFIVPEPVTLGLFGIGGLALLRRRAFS